MSARLFLCVGLASLAACSSNVRTTAHAPESGVAPNVTVYLSNQRPGWGRATLTVYVDDRLVVRHTPDLDIHVHHEVGLHLPPGPHRIRVAGPSGGSTTKEIVVGSLPLFLCASWWSTREGTPITIEVYEGEMPGFC